MAPSLQSGLEPVPRKGGYSTGVVGAPAPRRSQMGCPGSGLGSSGHLFQTAGQTFGGHGVRFEEPLLLGTPRKMSLQMCLGTGLEGQERGGVVRGELQDSNGRIQTQKPVRSGGELEGSGQALNAAQEGSS